MLLVQPSMFSSAIEDEDIDSGYRVPLHTYKAIKKNRTIPPGTMLDLNMNKETPESLCRLSNRELSVLCRYWGCPSTGTKHQMTQNIILYYKTAQKVQELGTDGLAKLKAVKLRNMVRSVGGGSGAHQNKLMLAEWLVNWSQKVHESFCDQVAEFRHYEAVRKALAKGIVVPDEIIRGNKAYVNMERKAKGLTLDPAGMTTREWLSYINRIYGFSDDYEGILVNEKGAITEHSKREYHWTVVEQALQRGQQLPLKVVHDHVRQTQIRRASIEKSTPRGPGWEPVNLDVLKVGNILRKADGTKVKVVDISSTSPLCAITRQEEITARNLLYDTVECYRAWQLWQETPFRVGDKVEWISPGGQRKIGRIQFSRSRTDGFGEEFYIHTGQLMAAFPDQWEFFVAPVAEVKLIEPARAEELKEMPCYDAMDYVSWQDYEGRSWVGHVWNWGTKGGNTVTIWLYHPDAGPLHGPKVTLVMSQNPTLNKSSQKFTPTNMAIENYEQYIQEYHRKPNPAAWRYLVRLRDLFGFTLPQASHRGSEKH